MKFSTTSSNSFNTEIKFLKSKSRTTLQNHFFPYLLYMHLCICVCNFWFSKNCTKEKNKQTHNPTLAFHSYKIGLKPRTIGALLLPACCWFLVIAQSIRHTAGTPSCGGATGLWSTWLWRYVGPTAPMHSRSTDGLSICLLVGSTDWVSPSSPIPCEQSPQPEQIEGKEAKWEVKVEEIKKKKVLYCKRKQARCEGSHVVA